MRTAHTLVYRNSRIIATNRYVGLKSLYHPQVVCSVATHAVGKNAGYGLLIIWYPEKIEGVFG
ncbi:hypothetical protein ACTHSZ_13135 [Neisseria sp. P0006.S006]